MNVDGAAVVSGTYHMAAYRVIMTYFCEDRKQEPVIDYISVIRKYLTNIVSAFDFFVDIKNVYCLSSVANVR